MQNIVRRYSAVLMSALLILAVTVPAYATEIDYVSRDNFWNWIAGSNGIAQKFVGFLSFAGTCAQSEDSYHHASSYEYDTGDGHYGCVCIYCGKVFTAYASDLSAAYDDYVETLPAPSYTSDGSILWSPKLDYISLHWKTARSYYYYCPHGPKNEENSLTDACVASFDCENMLFSVRPSIGNDGFSFDYIRLYFKDLYPIDGYYSRISSPAFNESSVNSSSKPITFQASYEAETSTPLHYAGVTYDYSYSSKNGAYSYKYLSAQCYAPVYKITPFNPPESYDTTYNINTRPTSITGGNYGIVGDNGQITKVEDNSTIINETNNTFYNPATGTTVPIVNWSYDYSDRSYKVTLESGDTATVTYGDENITISQITTTEGDTITNNYTIYYLVDGSGSTTPPCDHDWQASDGALPTCTRPGSAAYVCSKCQQTKKDPLPALGHDWQVKQTVTTEYDDTGQLVQQGYTIFECSRCKEQYKSEDGTSPPDTPPEDPGEEEEKKGFFAWLWDVLTDALKKLIEGIIDAILKTLDFFFGGDGQSNYDFYNSPSTFSGVNVWAS